MIILSYASFYSLTKRVHLSTNTKAFILLNLSGLSLQWVEISEIQIPALQSSCTVKVMGVCEL